MQVKFNFNTTYTLVDHWHQFLNQVIRNSMGGCYNATTISQIRCLTKRNGEEWPNNSHTTTKPSLYFRHYLIKLVDIIGCIEIPFSLPIKILLEWIILTTITTPYYAIEVQF